MQRELFESDHEAFRDAVRAFVSLELRSQHEKIIATRAIPRETWLAAGAQGFLGLGVPEVYAGSGANDFRFNAVLTEELAACSLAFASSFGIHVDVVAPYLVELGTDEQKQQWLPGYCRGELIGAIAMTEPSAGSDVAGIRTRAVGRGTDWVLNGAKTFITNGHSADLFVVAARTSEDRTHGISMFVVDANTPGFQRGRKLDKIGQPEADTAELFFEDVRLPASGLLGEPNRGFHYMMQRLVHERMHGAVANVAHAYAIFVETLEYARTREAFGQPIGGFQHNRMLLADLATQLDVTRAFVDRCVAAHACGTATAVDAAKAKWWSAEVQNRVLDSCLQVHGGYGYMNEYRVGRAWADARVTKIWGGTNEIMRELIGKSLGL
jgi:alkylation response protein AidB-like acyl-CoA dehydrogenase